MYGIVQTSVSGWTLTGGAGVQVPVRTRFGMFQIRRCNVITFEMQKKKGKLEKNPRGDQIIN